MMFKKMTFTDKLTYEIIHTYQHNKNVYKTRVRIKKVFHEIKIKSDVK